MLVHELVQRDSVRLACRIFGVSASGYYRFVQRLKAGRRPCKIDLLQEPVEMAFKASRSTYGAPRVHAQLQKQGVPCSKSTVARTMQAVGLQARRGRRKKIITTRRDSSHPVCDRIFKVQDKRTAPRAPGQVLAGDITYFSTTSGSYYLAVVMDIFTRRIVGWSLDRRLKLRGALRALDLACRRSRPARSFIFHSDRGVQYTSAQFRRAVRVWGGVSSMSRKGNCYDNAFVESFFKTLKAELPVTYKTASFEELLRHLYHYIEIEYNVQRGHTALQGLSPQQFQHRWEDNELITSGARCTALQACSMLPVVEP